MPAGFVYLIIAGAGKDYTAASWKPSAQAFRRPRFVALPLIGDSAT